MRISAFITVTAALVVSLEVGGQGPSMANQLEAAERSWNTAMPRAYEFTFRYSAMFRYVGCESGSFHARVKSDAPVELSGCASLKDLFGTVPLLFKYIHGAIEKNPDTLEVTFDPALGYPVKFHIDHAKNVTDDTFDFEVTGFALAN